MKSCLGTLLLVLTIVALVGGGALVWYLSNNSEFTRVDGSASAAPSAPSKPVVPVPNNKPRVGPVR